MVCSGRSDQRVRDRERPQRCWASHWTWAGGSWPWGNKVKQRCGCPTIFEAGVLLMVGNWMCLNWWGRGVVKLRAGTARQHTRELLSSISLSPLFPQQVRCSEISPCYAAFSCWTRKRSSCHWRLHIFYQQSLVIESIAQREAGLTHFICLTVYSAFSAIGYLWF